MKLHDKKAFTLIELIIVIAVIGILVLLAAPKLLGYTEDAKLAQIANDIKAYESAIEIERINDETFIDEWELVDKADLEDYRDSGSLFDKKGEVKGDYQFNDEYLEVEAGLVNSKLAGDFILAKGGKVFYYDEGLVEGEQITPKFTVTFLDINDNVISTEMVKEGESATPPDIEEKHIDDGQMQFDGWDKDLDNISDDVTAKVKYKSVWGWISSEYNGYAGPDGINGYFSYRGTEQETVKIPHEIQGVEMTSYYKMFEHKGSDVKKVVSTNKNIKDMSYMFSWTKATELDLSSLDTSNVENMNRMFEVANSALSSPKLSLGGDFKTSNVKRMIFMFHNFNVDEVDLNSLDTSNVESMGSMFRNATGNILDLSSFNTNKVREATWSSDSGAGDMFSGSSITTGYARTQDDADRFNNSEGIPEGLEFTVK